VAESSTVTVGTQDGVETTCRLANTFIRRFVGLMGRRGLPAGTGVLFVPGGSIHTAFMRFPIDAVFIDAEGTVVRVAAGIRPWRHAAGHRARFVLELPSGQAGLLGTHAGARLQLLGDGPTWRDLGGRRRRVGLHRRPTAQRKHDD
jgi:uncharacterized membrane protein (UPF0127 family)